MREVFIGGCGRSGTTLLGAMLGAHSECIATPESQFKMDCFYLHGSNGEERPQDLRGTLRMITRHPRFRLWGVGIDPDEGVCHAASAAELLEWLVREYAISRGKPRPEVWIDHTGRNSRYAPTLLQHFPEARFVHLVRDGRAVAASVIPLDWGPNTVHRAAHWWTEHIAYGLASESYCGARAVRVSFEELVTNPEDTLWDLCRFLDLRFEPRMLLGEGFDVPDFTRRQHRLVDHPPDPGRALEWEVRLSSRQIEIFESLTGDLLRALGYPLRYGLSARPVQWSERSSAYAVETVQGLVLNRLRHVWRMRRSLRRDAMHAKQGSFVPRPPVSQLPNR